MDTRPGAWGLGWMLAATLVLVAPAAAQARPVYINAELSQEYYASRPTGEHWQSMASVSAYYRTTSQALSAGDGTLQLPPTATVGAFTASLSDPLPVVPLNCTWHGSRGAGHQLGRLQDGTPFARALSIQWPGYPAMWQQSLSRSSTSTCRREFARNPLQGVVQWALAGTTRTGGGNHFLFAAVPRAQAVEAQEASVAITSMAMTSQLTLANDQSDSVSSQGFLIESSVPFTGHRNVLPVPSIPAGGKLAAPLSAGALRRLALELVPRTVPTGCVVGQRRRAHERCP
jgi:hypothetical protein